MNSYQTFLFFFWRGVGGVDVGGGGLLTSGIPT